MSDQSTPYAAIVVGGGHNGLTAAAYLARAGRSVLLLERQDHLGGASVSAEAFAGTGARLSRYSYLVSLLPQQIIDDNRGSFTLGAEVTSPLGLAAAYATVFGSGTQCDVVPLTRLLDRDGKDVLGDDGQPLVHDKCTPEAIAPGIADTLTQMLRKDVERETRRRTR